MHLMKKNNYYLIIFFFNSIFISSNLHSETLKIGNKNAKITVKFFFFNLSSLCIFS